MKKILIIGLCFCLFFSLYAEEKKIVKIYITKNDKGNPALIDRYIPELNEIMIEFNKSEDKKILVEAYSGDIGTDETRKKDEKERLEIVKKFLISTYKLEENDIITESKGLSHPILANGSDEAKVANRRVEVKLK